MKAKWRFVLTMLPWLALPAAAGISIPPLGTGVILFTSAPPVEQWTTWSVAGASTDILTVADLDTAVQTIDTSRVTNALTTTGTHPPSENAFARWNSVGGSLQTRPAGNAFTVLLATLRNDTAHAATSLRVSYFLNITPGSLGTEPVPGQRVYFSLTGVAGSWEGIASLTTATIGRLNATLPLGSWAPGASLYLLWADDNATSETDLGCEISQFEAAVPQFAGPVSVGPEGTGVWTFDAYPDRTNGWSTLGLPGGSTNITTASELEAQVQYLAATNISGVLWKEYTWPPDMDGGNPIAGYNYIGRNLQTRPAGCAAILLLATLQNDTGSNVSVLTISYDFSVASSNGVESVPGYLAYFSVTGLPGDWRLVPEFSRATSGCLRADLNLGSWAEGGLLYLLWADDNGPSGTTTGAAQTEGAYTLDNFVAVAGIVPPKLTITRVSEQVAEIAWPLEPSGFALQFTTNLIAPSWQTATETNSPSGGFHRAAVDISMGTRVFRLELQR